MTAHHGTLWLITKNMLANTDKKDYIGNRKVLIERGEIVEWRYECDNHFRTKDDKWFCVDDATWNEHAVKIGKILDKVQFDNEAKTEEIWRLRLFNWVENGRTLYNELVGNKEEEE